MTLLWPILADAGLRWPRQLFGLYDYPIGATTLSDGLLTKGESAYPDLPVNIQGRTEFPALGFPVGAGMTG